MEENGGGLCVCVGGVGWGGVRWGVGGGLSVYVCGGERRSKCVCVCVCVCEQYACVWLCVPVSV